MVIVTNIVRFPRSWMSSLGDRGQSVIVSSARDFVESAAVFPDAILLIDCDPRLAYGVAAGLAMRPWLRRPVVSVDLVLRRPTGVAGRLQLPVKRTLLRRVDHHIHYFRDLRGLSEVFGIGSHNSSFVPFKPNLSVPDEQLAHEGEYVLCFGRSLRDYDSFFAAVEQLPYPAAIPKPDIKQLARHGARLTRDLGRLPHNIEILDDDGSEAAQLRALAGARLVVLPILRSSIVASGISTALNAMRCRRCVIGSDGPGMLDVFSAEVLTAPPEDAHALAAVIRRAWEDDVLRHRVARAGERYAASLGGEPELYQRIVDQLMSWYAGSRYAEAERPSNSR